MQNLEKLLELRNTISKLQFEIEGLMPSAIAEAIDVLGSREGDTKQVVYKSETGKIVLVFKKQYPTPQNDLKLNRIDCDLKGAIAKICQDNADELARVEAEIQSHKQAIAALESKREKLMSNRYISRLKNEYKKYREESMSLNPTLSVFL
jgi:hypothetical protein